MRKIIPILLTLVCMIALVGCSAPPVSTTEPSSTPSKAGLQEQAQQQTIKTPSPSSVPAPTPSPSPALIPKESKPPERAKEDTTMPTVNIQVGNKKFTVILSDNDSTRALLDKIPLTLNMDELNGNEKFYFFSEKFPTNSERVGNIKTGDLMLYGSDCLVLFYESFPTSYSYTKLGYVEDVTGLADALGSGSVQVTFSIAD